MHCVRPVLCLLGALAACSAVGFLGCCVYFDRSGVATPRSGSAHGTLWDPAKKKKNCKNFCKRYKRENFGYPESVSGEHQLGVEHLSNALLVCGQPQELLKVFQHTLPPKVFEMLLHKILRICQQFEADMNEQEYLEDDHD